MKPVSSHWADIAAAKVIHQKKDQDHYTVASGITPSGTVHVGNFREVITVDLVARALKDQGKGVRFIYSWDNFDTFRKVPKNIPNPEDFTSRLGEPIARIPDPYGKARSYAQGRMDSFEAELALVGIMPEFRYQEELYSQGTYGDAIIHALENKDKIVDILNPFRSKPLGADWLPTSLYCSQCQKDDILSQKYLGEGKIHYQCRTCSHEETVSIKESKNIKLLWRIDWPMRWHHEKVDFEPGGKDHSSQGGSFDTGQKILETLWGESPPQYLQYDFVAIKGGAGKMSSSSGELITLSQVLEVYEPEIIRYIFASHRPNHDFAIAFDEDVIKIYEEFDRKEALAFSPKPEKKEDKWKLNQRIYQFSTLDHKIPEVAPKRAGFRVLCNRLQICNGNLERTFERYYQEDCSHPLDQARFYSRAKRAWNWLENYAPAEFKYALHTKPVHLETTTELEHALSAFRELISRTDLEQVAPNELNELIWQHAIHPTQCEASQVFKAIYQKLIGRDQGPRLPSFLKEIGKNRLLELI